jgi:hypothetical protein
MNIVIDLATEVLLDRSAVTNPYVLLLASALGQPLAQGSPWVALDKQSAMLCGLTRHNVRRPLAVALRNRTTFPDAICGCQRVH